MKKKYVKPAVTCYEIQVEGCFATSMIGTGEEMGGDQLSEDMDFPVSSVWDSSQWTSEE